MAATASERAGFIIRVQPEDQQRSTEKARTGHACLEAEAQVSGHVNPGSPGKAFIGRVVVDDGPVSFLEASQ